mgnify:CR=1 FL=1
MTEWVVITTAPDGTKSVQGIFAHEMAATLYANEVEVDDVLAEMVPLERISKRTAGRLS